MSTTANNIATAKELHQLRIDAREAATRAAAWARVAKTSAESTAILDAKEQVAADRVAVTAMAATAATARDQADADRIAAEAAAVEAAGAVAMTVRRYDDIADLVADNSIPDAIQVVLVDGFDMAGRGGRHTRRRRQTGDPAIPGAVTTIGGKIFDLDEVEADARIFGLRDGGTPADNTARINDALAWSSATKRAAKIIGDYRAQVGIKAQTDAKLLLTHGKLRMSGDGSAISNLVASTAVNRFMMFGGEMIADTATNDWDGNVFDIYGDGGYLEDVTLTNYGKTGGRAFGGGGTFRQDIPQIVTTAGSAVIRVARDFFIAKDFDRRLEVASAGPIIGAGPTRAPLQGWIREIRNDAGADYATCELYDWTTGLPVLASVGITTSGWIGRCGVGTTTLRCRWQNFIGGKPAGIRVGHGGGQNFFGEVDSWDDAALQAVNGMGSGFGARQDIDGVVFAYMRGGSRNAKMVTITQGGGNVLPTDWHSTRNVMVIGHPGYAGGRAYHIECADNDTTHEYGRSRVFGITLRDLVADMGEANTESRAPFGLNVLNKTGNKRAVDMILADNCGVLDPWQEAIQAEGSLGLIEVRGGEYGPTRRTVTDLGVASPRSTVKVASPDVQLVFTGKPIIHAPVGNAPAIALNYHADGTGKALVDLGKAAIVGLHTGQVGVDVDGAYRVVLDSPDFLPADGATGTTALVAHLNRGCEVIVGAATNDRTALGITTQGSGSGKVAHVRPTLVSYDGVTPPIANNATIAYAIPGGRPAGVITLNEGPNFFTFGYDTSGTPQPKPGPNVGNRFSSALGTADRINIAVTSSGLTIENLSGGTRTLGVTVQAT